MKNLLTLMLLLSFISCESEKTKEKSIAESKKINLEIRGIYELKSSKKTEKHFIIIDTLNGKFAGSYFGTENKNQYGTAHFSNSLEHLTIEKNKIKFEIGKRNLYKSTLFRIAKFESDLENDSIIGVSEYRIKFKGKLFKNGFKFICESEMQNCWDKKLTFEKVSK
ncbi:hypothetical protein [Lacinutrix salivirga]